MNTPAAPDVDKLAAAFVVQCMAQFTADELAVIRYRNRDFAKAGKGDVCATHDFADANMIMLDAFKDAFDREPAILDGGASVEEHNADATLWGAAWDKAKADFLTAPDDGLRAAAIIARDMLAAHMVETFGPDEAAHRETVFWPAYDALRKALA